MSPCLSIEHVQVAQIKKNTMTVDIFILDKRKASKQQLYWRLEQKEILLIRILSEPENQNEGIEVPY
jgi:uncharacterized membrane protein YsdA (DUF1294 family)